MNQNLSTVATTVLVIGIIALIVLVFKGLPIRDALLNLFFICVFAFNVNCLTRGQDNNVTVQQGCGIWAWIVSIPLLSTLTVSALV